MRFRRADAVLLLVYLQDGRIVTMHVHGMLMYRQVCSKDRYIYKRMGMHSWIRRPCNSSGICSTNYVQQLHNLEGPPLRQVTCPWTERFQNLAEIKVMMLLHNTQPQDSDVNDVHGIYWSAYAQP